MHAEMLIGGEFAAGGGEPDPVVNPKTGAKILDIAGASPDQVDRAVAAATRAFGSWSRTTPAQRAALMLKLADRIEAEAADFAALEAQNCGKPFNAVLNDEMPAIVDSFRFFAGAARVVSASAAGEYLPGFTSMIAAIRWASSARSPPGTTR
jgi:aminobutyraldehyde dehydrogenase